MLPLGQAVKLPVCFFGKVKFHDLSGEVMIDSSIRLGMIKIGYKWRDLFPTSFLPNQLWISGILIFKGGCIIGGGVGVFVQKKKAILEIGNNTTIGAGTLVKSMDKLVIGDYTRITGNCIIMNSNMHFVKNIDTGLIAKPYGPIVIGNHCWINSGTTITKGAIVPNYSIVARNSFLSKDYTEHGPNAFIAGSPAKIKNNSSQRIYNLKKEAELADFFNNNPEADYYDDGIGLFEETNEKVF